jgi:undecaprenyl-diphosphatase
MTEHQRTSPYPPLHGRVVAARLVGGGLVLALALSLIGWAIVTLATPSALTRWEVSVNQWFYAARTPTLDTVSHIGSYLAETITCIVLLVVLTLALRLWLGRWRESWALVAALVGELLVFLVVTAVVNRPRPTVPHLDAAPPTSSFPSGHTAAAVAFYGCLAVIVLRELRPGWFARVVAALLILVPVVVGVARLYRGMHHPTDVVFGALGGGLWLALVLSTLLPRTRHDAAPTGSTDAREEPERLLST